MAAAAEVVVVPRSDAAVRQLSLSGEFDASNIGQLECALFGDGPSTVVLDLTDTMFIDSQFIGLLAVAYRDGMRIVVRGASRTVRRALGCGRGRELHHHRPIA